MDKRFLKEDGSMDIERIDNLPREEFRTVMKTMTREQKQEYFTGAAIDRVYGTAEDVIKKHPECVIKDPEAYLRSHEYMTLEEFMERMSKYC